MALRRADRRYRYLYKPLLFTACLVPLLGYAGGIARLSGLTLVPGFRLGADPVRFVLDGLGKTALNLLWLTLAVSPLRRLTGNAQLLRLRRMLGLFAFTYALAHFLIYVGVFKSLDWRAIVQDIAKRPFITLGFLALLLLVPLAATSTQAMMRRLRSRWQTLHRLIYLIAPLGVAHYWKMLKSDYHQPLLYAALLALLLGERVWRSARRRMHADAMRPAALP